MKKLIFVLPLFVLAFGAASKSKGLPLDITTGVSYPHRLVPFPPPSQKEVKGPVDLVRSEVVTGASYYWIPGVQRGATKAGEEHAMMMSAAEGFDADIITGATYYWIPGIQRVDRGTKAGIKNDVRRGRGQKI